MNQMSDLVNRSIVFSKLDVIFSKSDASYFSKLDVTFSKSDVRFSKSDHQPYYFISLLLSHIL